MLFSALGRDQATGYDTFHLAWLFIPIEEPQFFEFPVELYGSMSGSLHFFRQFVRLSQIGAVKAFANMGQ